MIYISSTIEPLDSEEFEVLSISLVRKEEQNESGESRYVYGGWYKDKEGDNHYFTSEVYINRTVPIMEFIGKLCLDASEKNRISIL
jgi:hypothetical protein